jgi:hypothetical protein
MAKADQLSGVRKWLEREEWAEPFNELLQLHLEAPCTAADMGIEELPDVIGDAFASNLFGCVFEDMLATEFEDGSNIVDDYLKRRGWKEAAPNKRYMTALRTSVMSLYEVSGIVRDRSFLARDLLRGGEPVLVSEKLATRDMKPWDLLAARIVKVGSKTEMAGGVLLFSREIGESIREGFAELREKMRAAIQSWQEQQGGGELDPHAFDTEVLRRAAFLFSNAWLESLLQKVLDPTLPMLTNSDGDTIEFTTVRYPLKPGADRKALGDGIAAIPGFRVSTDDHWDWGGLPAPSEPRNESDDVERLEVLLPDDSVLLATVELEGDSLRVETNSPQRAKRARALLDPIIGPFVAEPVVEARTVEEMMDSRPAKGELPPLPGVSPEEERKFVHESLDRHYRAVLDQPVPALGDVSPRESAKTTDGRKRLVGWLKGLENANAQLESDSAIASYDASWLWEELGVSDQRR